jgi:phage protein D/phage baseplate assembly protein gpV
VTRSQLPLVKVDGQALDESLRRALVEVVVDDHRALPDGFSLRFIAYDADVLDRSRCRIGTKVEIVAGQLGETQDSTLIVGEVTSIEGQFEDGTQFLVVRGYDQSHRLHAGRRTTTYNDVSDSDLAQRVASSAGLSVGTIESTRTVHEHVSQVNMTDWEFLQERAAECGATVAVRDGKFSFTLGSPASTSPIELEIGKQLEVFRSRVTGNQQVTKVEVRGWDPEQKEAVSETATSETDSVSLSESGWSPDELASTLGSPEYRVTHRPISTAGEATTIAKATADGIASSFAEAEGTAIGDPRLQTGRSVTVKGAGAFDGSWVISHSHHRFDDDGYHTDFEVAGRQERSLLGLTSMGATTAGPDRIPGTVVGLVTNVQDPLNIGRVKLKFPWLAPDYESGWARTCFPGAGKERGFMVVPEVDDEVLVVFEHGDVRSPFVVGSLYNGKDAPKEPSYQSGGEVTKRSWVSRRGHMIAISDDDGAGSITIDVKDGSYSIVLSEQDDKITITTKGKLVVEAQDDIEITSKKKIKLSGQSVEVEGQADLKLKGASASFEASGTATVKGATVSIN